MEELQWFYVPVGATAQHGPVPVSVLHELWERKELAEHCYVWNPTLETWTIVSELPDLHQSLLTSGGGGGGGGGDEQQLQQNRAGLESINPERMQRQTWQQLQTADGLVYYHNLQTNETTWEAPEEFLLQQQGQQQQAQQHGSLSGAGFTQERPEGDWVWIPDPEEGYIAGKLLQQRGEKAFCQREDGEVITVNLEELEEEKLEPLDWTVLEQFTKKTSPGSGVQATDDLALLSGTLSRPVILWLLRERWIGQNEIYTDCGKNLLVSINPYHWLPLYTPSILQTYINRGSRELAPHVFGVADNAYKAFLTSTAHPTAGRGTGGGLTGEEDDLKQEEDTAAVQQFQLRQQRQSQSIIISGESGSGKTECTKQCLQYLAEIAGSADNVEQRILLANPILEAFGNAKTLRNDNSSRFGKFIQIFFDQSAQISGAATTFYLLEKVRVVRLLPGERNYHIFYQLVSGADPILRTQLGLNRPALPLQESHHHHHQQYQHHHLGGVTSAAQSFFYLLPSDLRPNPVTSSGQLGITAAEERRARQPSLETQHDFHQEAAGLEELDRQEYKLVVDAMSKLGFRAEELGNIFRILSLILHLGNIQFIPHTTSAGAGGAGGKSGEAHCSIEPSLGVEALRLTAALMQVNPAQLQKTLTTRQISVSQRSGNSGGPSERVQYTEVGLTAAEASQARDALGKFIYEKLFLWLVERINASVKTTTQALQSNPPSPAAGGATGESSGPTGRILEAQEQREVDRRLHEEGWIGLLDIFGFEDLEENTFEQLCINYANERLQQSFNEWNFREEEAVYRREEVDFAPISWPDNQACLDLIAGTSSSSSFSSPSAAPSPLQLHLPGIFPWVDQLVREGQGNRENMISDQDFVRQLLGQHAESNPCITGIPEDADESSSSSSSSSSHASSAAKQHSGRGFMIRHYAGVIRYSAEEFLLKNMDEMNHYTVQLVRSAGFPFITELFLPKPEPVLHLPKHFQSSSSSSSPSPEAGDDASASSSPSSSQQQQQRTDLPTIADPVKQKDALGLKFGKQLHRLMAVLNSTTPHYIKCIKPNTTKQPGVWDGALVERQLRYAGIFEAIQIRKHGYPFRLTHEEFFQRYKCVQQVHAAAVQQHAQPLPPPPGEASSSASLHSIAGGPAEETGTTEEEEGTAAEAKAAGVQEQTVVEMEERKPDEQEEEAEEKKEEEEGGAGKDMEEEEEDKEEEEEGMEEEGMEEVEEEDDGKEEEEDISSSSSASSSASAPAPGKESSVLGRDDDPKQSCLDLIQFMGLSPEKVLLGKHMVLYRAEEHRRMEAQRNQAVESSSIYIQKFIRAKLAANLAQRCREIRPRLQAVIQTRDMAQVEDALHEADRVGFTLLETRQLRRMKYVFQEEKRLTRIFEVLVQTDPQEYFPQYQDSVAAANEIQLETPLANRVRELLNQAIAYRTQMDLDAKELLKVMDESVMRDHLQKADEIGFSSPTLERIRFLLYETSEDEFVKLQLKAAVKLKDRQRVTARTIRLKSLFFDKAGDLFKFTKFPLLQDKVAWAKQKFFLPRLSAYKKEQLAMDMLRWTRTPIHAPVTVIGGWNLNNESTSSSSSSGGRRSGGRRGKDRKSSSSSSSSSSSTAAERKKIGKLRKIAISMFKNILGYMGDRKYSTPDLLAQELLQYGITEPLLRNELYCQIIKQLTGNKDRNSRSRGWSLMLLCLASFPPGPEFENYLEMYLRTHQPLLPSSLPHPAAGNPRKAEQQAAARQLQQFYLDTLHLTQYSTQPRTEAPSLEQMHALLQSALAGENRLAENLRDGREDIQEPEDRSLSHAVSGRAVLPAAAAGGGGSTKFGHHFSSSSSSSSPQKHSSSGESFVGGGGGGGRSGSQSSQNYTSSSRSQSTSDQPFASPIGGGGPSGGSRLHSRNSSPQAQGRHFRHSSRSQHSSSSSAAVDGTEEEDGGGIGIGGMENPKPQESLLLQQNVWHYVSVDGNPEGPVDLGQLKQAWQTGQTNGNCLCWTPVLADWATISTLSDLVAWLSAP